MALLRGFVLSAVIAAAASGALAAPGCTACQREYRGRTFKITGFWFHQPTWCDAGGTRYTFDPVSGCWRPHVDQPVVVSAPHRKRAAKTLVPETE